MPCHTQRPRRGTQRLSLLVAAGLLAAPAARAELAPLLQLGLEELMKVEIVSASRRAQTLGDVAAAVHVITREDIRRAGARSLPEALRLAPGMDVAQVSGAYHAVTARGFPGRYADKLQVLIDGRSLYWEMFSGVQWEAERVPLDDIERIEVIRGPAGAVWGANAVNGVVNVITRAAADTHGTRVQARAATRGEHALTLEHGWGAGDATGPDVRLYAQREGSGALRTDAGAPANDRTRATSAGLRADWQLPRGARLSLRGDVVRSESGAVWRVPLLVPPYRTLLPAPQRVERATLGSTYERALAPDLDLAVQGSLSAARLDNGSLGRYHGRSAELDARGHWRLGPGHNLILGVGGRWTGSDFNTPADSLLLRFDPAYRSITEWGLYVQDERVLAEHFRLTLGGRIDRHSLTGTSPQPSARLLWNLSESSSVWTALSRAVRVPSRLEADAISGLGVVPPSASTGGLPLLVAAQRGAFGALSAETVDALEAGWRTQWSPTLSLDVAAFANRYRNSALGNSGLGAPTFVARPQPHLLALVEQRTGSVRSNGLEVAVDWRITPGWRQQLSWSGLRFNGAADALPLAAQASPRQIIQLRSSIDLDANTTLDLMLHHNAERGTTARPDSHTPALTELDAHLVWRVSPTVDLTFSGRNLLHRSRVQVMPDFGLYEPVRIERSFGIGLQARF
ncbi:TonB-dependent receptor plug domain-containing protein [Azohydromonas aeria]|uniref:TonB-dependent receptor plug domain-containing protein n=1 Tax=Azohydromonas aeria TaxID=2590212 RepID=UPI0018E015E4|nr:TonB-dependent receptor [Azohydromonas aeria]